MNDDWKTRARPAYVAPATYRERHTEVMESMRPKELRLESANEVMKGCLLGAEVALQTPNTSNARQHWAVTAKRAKSQRSALKREVGKWLLTSGPRLVITVTRVSPRRIDSTNLGSALKSVVDGIADALKVDDGAEWLEWRLEQAKGKPAVRWRMHWTNRGPE